MNKAIYSEEEVKKLLQSLFVEKKKVQDLKEKIETLGSERDELLNQIDLIQEKSLSEGPLELGSPELASKLEALQERKARSVDLEEMRKLKILVVAMKKKLDAQNNSQNDDTSDHRITLEASKAEQDSLEKQLHEAKMEKDRESSQYQETISKLYEQLEKSREGTEGLSALHKKVEELNEQIDQLHLEKSAAEERFLMAKLQSDKLAQAQKGKIEELQVQISQLRTQLTGTQEEQAKRTEEIVSLQNERVRVAESKSAEVERDLEEAKNRSEHWEKRHAIVEEQSRALKEKHLHICQRLENSEKEFSGAKETLTLLQEKLERALSEQPQLVLEKEEVKRQAVAAEAKLEEVKNLLSLSNEQQQRQKVQNDRLITIIREKEGRVNDLKHFEQSYKKGVVQVQDLENTLQQERVVIQTLEEKVIELKELISQKEVEITQLEEGLQDFEERYQSLSVERELLKNQCEVLEHRERELSRCLEEETLSHASIQKEYDALQKIYEETSESDAKEKSRLQDELKERFKSIQAINQEMNLIKQTLVRGIRESKEIESQYHNAISEKAQSTAALVKAKEEALRQDKEFLKVQQSLLEANESKRTLEARAEYLEQSISTLKTQAEALQSRTDELSEDLKNSETMTEVLCSEKQALNLEKEALEQSIVEHSEIIKDLGKGSETLKEEIRSLHERKSQLEENLQTLHETIHGLNEEKEERERQILQEQARSKELENICQDLQEKYELLKEGYHSAGEQIEEVLEARSELQERHNELNNVHERTLEILKEKEEHFRRLSEVHQLLQVEKAKIEEISKDRDMRTKELQQHLHNKVKEATLTAERLEEFRNALHDAQATINSQQSKIQDLGEMAQEYRKKEERLEKLLNESIKANETQITKWEEKYLTVHSKAQELESQNREYRQREDKYRHVEKLLANLGNLITEPLGATAALNAVPQFSEMPSEKHAQFARVEEEEAPLEFKRAQAPTLEDLFEAAKVAPKMKETLF